MTSFLSNGYRTSKNGNGKFLTFASLSKGFEAAAYLLIHANKAYGYQLALNALKRGGNQAAADFLAALAMSSWDAAHYGATDWLSAYNPATNHLLRTYQSITGVQFAPAAPKKKPTGKHKPPPFIQPPNYQKVVGHYLDPYAAGDLYKRRHSRPALGQNVDGTTRHR